MYEANGTVLLVGPNGAITPAPFDMVPGERGLVAGTIDVDASWVEALRRADAIVAVFVLGRGDIAQVRFDLDRRGGQP